MKRIFITFAALLTLNIPTLAYQVTTITPIPQSNAGYYNSYPKITQIENMMFNRGFENEDIYSRLNKIEQKMFNTTNPNASLSERVDNILGKIDPGALYNIPIDKLSQIENKLFARTYSNDDTETRIIRLEKEMLGAMQGGDLEERFQTVAEAAKHYNAFPYQEQQPYYGQQTYSPNMATAANTGGVKGIFKNILGAMVGGTLTGYTPPIYNNSYAYNNNNPYYQNSVYPNSYSAGNNWGQNYLPQSNSSAFNSYNQSNRGYYNKDTNYGTGTGVHVLYD